MNIYITYLSLYFPDELYCGKYWILDTFKTGTRYPFASILQEIMHNPQGLIIHIVYNSDRLRIRESRILKLEES